MSDGQMTLPKTAYERQEQDFYATPAWITQLICERVKMRGPVWEPAAGDGAMARVLRDNGHEVACTDIQGDALGCQGCEKADFLTVPAVYTDGPFTICTNPPFLLAHDFIAHALKLIEPSGGILVLLLRNEYDCAIKRRLFFARPSFREKIVLTRRPLWFPGVPDNHPRHNFSIFVWDAAHIGAPTIRWLPEREDQRGRLTRKLGWTPRQAENF